MNQKENETEKSSTEKEEEPNFKFKKREPIHRDIKIKLSKKHQEVIAPPGQ